MRSEGGKTASLAAPQGGRVHVSSQRRYPYQQQ